MGERRVVVLADVSSWEAWLYLAGALRANGFDAVRHTVRPESGSQRIRVALERPVFSKTYEDLVMRHGHVDVSSVLPWLGRIQDIQMVDIVGDAITATDAWAQHPALHRVGRAGMNDTDVYDKLRYSQLAQSVGVPVPEMKQVAAALPEGAWVLKGRVGSGGERVTLVSDQNDVSVALRTWGIAAGDAFLQACVGGEAWNVGGVAYRGEVLVSAAFRAMPADDDPNGPPVQIRIEHQPEQLAATAALVDALGYSGPFCADFLDDGTPFLLDFNPRFFGSWAALQSAGVDVLGAYLWTLGRPWSGPSDVALGVSIPASVGGARGLRNSWRRGRDVASRLGPTVGKRASAFILVDGLAQGLPRG
ncbi:MAG: ATP-grasp domain-containing protein [Actinobacteria bacterium]|nr:MAG: ATP-grasp domain-containing protein [Actinomycetota bacterium]